MAMGDYGETLPNNKENSTKIFFSLLVQAGKAKRRKNDGPLYLEAVDLTLRETSQLGSVPSSERPKKITATKELVLPENQLVKKKAMALQA